jgi:hypothetical protein
VKQRIGALVSFRVARSAGLSRQRLQPFDLGGGRSERGEARHRRLRREPHFDDLERIGVIKNVAESGRELAGRRAVRRRIG